MNHITPRLQMTRKLQILMTVLFCAFAGFSIDMKASQSANKKIEHPQGFYASVCRRRGEDCILLRGKNEHPVAKGSYSNRCRDCGWFKGKDTGQLYYTCTCPVLNQPGAWEVSSIEVSNDVATINLKNDNGKLKEMSRTLKSSTI